MARRVDAATRCAPRLPERAFSRTGAIAPNGQARAALRGVRVQGDDGGALHSAKK